MNVQGFADARVWVATPAPSNVLLNEDGTPLLNEDGTPLLNEE